MDVFKKTLTSDGVASSYRGFLPSIIGIVVYRGLWFGMYDSIKPLVLTGALEDNLLASFLFSWTVVTTVTFATYPLSTIRCRTMMRSGEVNYKITDLRSEPPKADLHTLGREV